MTMIERVARALATKHYADRFLKSANDEQVKANIDGNWQTFTDEAKVAIKAMERPITDEMIVAGTNAVHNGQNISEIFDAMIDAALAEETRA